MLSTTFSLNYLEINKQEFILAVQTLIFYLFVFIMGSFLWTKSCPFVPFCEVTGLKFGSKKTTC